MFKKKNNKLLNITNISKTQSEPSVSHNIPIVTAQKASTIPVNYPGDTPISYISTIKYSK